MSKSEKMKLAVMLLPEAEAVAIFPELEEFYQVRRQALKQCLSDKKVVSKGIAGKFQFLNLVMGQKFDFLK